MKQKCFLLILALFCSSTLITSRVVANEEFLIQPVSDSGKLIVFAGISGSGKSTTAKALAALCNSPCYLEPEEHEWPDFIRVKQPYGEFSSFIVARAIRVNALWLAWQEKMQGNLVFMDSYYDKITGYYLDKPGMEWLISPNDPYFDCAWQVTQLDIELLPDADCIVLFEIGFDDWITMLDSRGRVRDNIDGFRANYIRYKAYIADAVEQVCQDRNIPFVRFHQKLSNPYTQAQALKSILIEQNIIPEDEVIRSDWQY